MPDKRAVDFLLTMFPDAKHEELDWGIKLEKSKKESTGNPVGRKPKYKHSDGTPVGRKPRDAFRDTGLSFEDFPEWLSNSKYAK